MPAKLAGTVVVITGAASGIGRAAALEFANRGARVVAAARREQALHDLAEEARRAGGTIVPVPTDVSDEADVQVLARQAVERFGRIDVWVNNAAVTHFSRFEETPPEAYRRVIETNLFGCIHGARAVLPHFRAQGHGVLINTASILGRVGQPYTSAYVTSKWAVRGFTECLRQELLDAPEIHACAVLPAAIDTPLFQQAANYTGRAAKALRPTYPAEQVARAIVKLAERPRKEVIVGTAGRFISWQHTLAPRLSDRLMARQTEMDHFSDEPAPPTDGNLFQPLPQYASVSGGWRENAGPQPPPLPAAGAALALPAVFGLLWWRRRRSRTLRQRLAGARPW